MSHSLNLILVTLVSSSSVVFVPLQQAARAVSPALSAPLERIALLATPVISTQPALTDRTLIAQATPETDDPAVLELGDRGEQVEALQQLLQQLGYPIEPDGFYGDQTKFAIIDFQQKEGLPVDGEVGATTWERLQAVAQATPTESAEATSPGSSPAAESPASPAEASPEAIAPLPSPAESPGAEAIETETDPPAAEESGLFYRFLGVAALLLVGAGIGTLVYLNRPKSIKKPIAAKQFSDPVAPPPASGSAPVEERSEVAIASTNANGSHPIGAEHYPESSNGSAAAPAHSPTPTTVVNSTSIQTTVPESEVTRLPKVNLAEELMKDLHHPDPGKRRKAIWELGQQGDSRAIQPLTDLILESDSKQRSLILAAISEIGMRSLKPMNRALLLSLQDESAEVRKNAIRDITRIYDLMVQLSHILHHASEDEDTEVRETANWALEQLNRIRKLEKENGARFTGSSASREYLPGDIPSSSEN